MVGEDDNGEDVTVRIGKGNLLTTVDQEEERLAQIKGIEIEEF